MALKQSEQAKLHKEKRELLNMVKNLSAEREKDTAKAKEYQKRANKASKDGDKFVGDMPTENYDAFSDLRQGSSKKKEEKIKILNSKIDRINKKLGIEPKFK